VAPRPAPRHVRIFLASPGDVAEERQEVRQAMQRLEGSPSIREWFTIEVVSWDDPEAPVPMLATITPQQAVSLSLPMPADCDVTIVILWSRIGTPLEELKADGTAYLSGTQWEFENARRANKPVLLYRRTTPPPVTAGDAAEAARQLERLEQFLAQFKGPGGTLRGGITTYKTLDEFAARVRTDVELLLQPLRRSGSVLPADAGRLLRAQAFVRSWPIGRFLMFAALGALVTVAAWTASATFAEVVQKHDPPPLAYAVRYAILTAGAVVPLITLLVTWWWLGRERENQG
jgi:hypothetical protein